MSAETAAATRRPRLVGLAAILLVTGLTDGSRAAVTSFDSDGDLVPDTMDAYPCDPSISSTAYAPGQNLHGMILTEDQWPAQGDFDFNDVVLAYNYLFRLDASGRVVSMRLNLNVTALGGIFDNGLGLRLPVARSEVSRITRSTGVGITTLPLSSIDADATVYISNNLREFFGNTAGVINSDPTVPVRASSPVEIEILFRRPQALPVSLAPYDLFAFRTGRPDLEIHLPDYRGTARMDVKLFNTGDDHSSGGRNFVNAQGIPFMLHLPVFTNYPSEGQSIDLLYPDIVFFGLSGGTFATNFYEKGVNLTYAYRDVNGKGPPNPKFLHPIDLLEDQSCIQEWGIIEDWGTLGGEFTREATFAAGGDVITTGFTDGSFLNGQASRGALDGFVKRFDRTTGVLEWMAQIGTAGDDTGRDIVLDTAGNTYVVGEQSDMTSRFFSGALSGVSDAFITKLDPYGNVVWTRVISGPGNDAALGIDIDAKRNLYVTGYATAKLDGARDPGGFPSTFLAKFDSDGNRLWLRQFRTDALHPKNYSRGRDVAVDRISGKVYVFGTELRSTRSTSPAPNAVLSQHLASDGAMLWVKHIGDHGYWNGGGDSRMAYGRAVDVDQFDGMVYITGSFAALGQAWRWDNWSRITGDSSFDVFLMKVAPDKSTRWSHSLASNELGLDLAEGVHSGGVGGTVFFTGRTHGTLPGQLHRGGSDFFIAAYSHNGQRRWLEQGGTPGMDMGHFGARTEMTQTGGVLETVGHAEASMTAGFGAWRTRFFRHDITTGAFQDLVVARYVDWRAGDWTECSNLCGEGIKTRTVSCTHPNGALADSTRECIRVQPPTLAACTNYSACEGVWTLGAWTTCTSACGVGEHSRSVLCLDPTGVELPEDACGGERPPSTDACIDYSRCTYSWNVARWSPCDAQGCRLGRESRSVACMRSDGSSVDDASCGDSRPTNRRACFSSVCAGSDISCAALYERGVTMSGRYDIDPDGDGPAPSVNVYCDMTSNGGGWTNIDLENERLWLNKQHYIACTAGLGVGVAEVRCRRPRFDGREDRPLYQFGCGGGDRSTDYLLDHVAPLLGHQTSPGLGFTSLTVDNLVGGGQSDDGEEYCFAHGIVARYDHLACSEYRVASDSQFCVPGEFVFGL